MSRPRWRTRRVVAAALAATWAATLVVLPPASLPPVGKSPDAHVPMSFHVHTTRSDGTGTREDIARAAARAGIGVVVVTDHGDGRRPADPPAYLDGVLVIDGIEVSSWGGHYAALGSAPAPYPLGGEPLAVVEDVARLGGIGIVAHPGSAKEELRWREWDAPFDGLEWLNADSEWRDRPQRLWRTVLSYPWRPVQALTALVDEPAVDLRQWDQLIARRPVVGLAAHDAHARLGLRGVGEPYDGWVALELPSYAALLGSFANLLVLPAPLSGDASADAAAVLAVLKAGRVYGVVTGLARSGSMRFEAESGGLRATMGESLVPSGSVQVTFDADVPAGARSALHCNGAVVAEADGGRLTWSSTGVPGACRAAVRVPWAGAVRPWLATNPIYVRAERTLPTPPAQLPPTVVEPMASSAAPGAWTVEAASDASGAVAASAVSPGGIDFSWRLGPAAQTFAAIQLATPATLATFDRIVLRASADRPMRVWVQLRVPGGDGQRWGHSIFLDATPREIAVPVAAMVPFARVDRSRPPLSEVTALLLVSDTVHAAPGSSGRLTLASLALAR